MLQSALLLGALLFVQSVAAVAEWGQCDGLEYTGSKVCDSGLVCVYINDWYSQCQKAPSTTTSATSSRASSSTTTAPSNTPVTTGFVRTSGQKFTLNGATYTLVGSNAYWIPQLSSTADITYAFQDLVNAGFTTLRTWGFNEVTSASGTYYQIWSGSTPTINTGSSGLGKFDIVVAQAKAAGIRLIVALTNNWADYGGMDVYVRQITGSENHDYFYTNSAVKTAFKNYVNTFVSRYKNEPTILAWELANEPRCRGSTGTSTGTCTTTTITSWAQEMSAYIKSIDSNHLVSLGDEGFFNQPSNPSYPYQGGEGIDFTANMAISTLDFGSFHLYPEPWGQSSPGSWGATWITDHATVQKSVGKPVVLGEFGSTGDQYSIYSTWYSTVVSSGITGDMIWQAGSRMPSGTVAHDDGYTVFPDEQVYQLQKTHSAALKARG